MCRIETSEIDKLLSINVGVREKDKKIKNTILDPTFGFPGDNPRCRLDKFLFKLEKKKKKNGNFNFGFKKCVPSVRSNTYR